MGFFSWKTCDTKESIPNRHSNQECRTVYLLQPNGEPPIRELAYDGYGMFGSPRINVYDWLAAHNGLKNAEVAIKILYESGHKAKDGKIFFCIERRHAKEIINLVQKSGNGLGTDIVAFQNFSSVVLIDGVRASMNDHIDAKRVEPVYFKGLIQFPLKFSFNPTAVYEQFQASEDCEFQGYFY